MDLPSKRKGKNMSLHHLIFIFVVQCCNCTTPIISLEHLPKKKEEKHCIISLFMLCYVATVPPLYWNMPLYQSCLWDMSCFHSTKTFIVHWIQHTTILDLHPLWTCLLDQDFFPCHLKLHLKKNKIIEEKMAPISPIQLSFNLVSTSPPDMSFGLGFLLLPPQASVKVFIKREWF